LKLFKKKTKIAAPADRHAALAFVPVIPEGIRQSHETGGCVRLHYAAAPGRLAALVRGAAPVPRTLELDELGTAVWMLIDGRRPVSGIAQALAQRYKLHQSEAELSVSAFLRQLGRRGLIVLREP
jgi:hypothetical protein